MTTERIYSPEGLADAALVPTARTPIGALAGRSIGVLDNGKAGAAHLLAHLGRTLAEREGAEFVGVYKKQTAATPCEGDLIDRIAAEVQVVLTGTAD